MWLCSCAGLQGSRGGVRAGRPQPQVQADHDQEGAEGPELLDREGQGRHPGQGTSPQGQHLVKTTRMLC